MQLKIYLGCGRLTMSIFWRDVGCQLYEGGRIFMKNRSRMWEVKEKTTGMWEYSFSKQWEAPYNVICYS